MKEYSSISKEDRYFEMRSDSSVGVGILDLTRDINNHFISKKTFDMTYWMINQCLPKKICSYSGFHHSVSTLLYNSIDNGNDLCIVLAQGIMIPKLHRVLKKVLKYYSENPDFFVIAHIMARQGRYPGLHRQMLVVNLKKWKELGSPEFNEQGFFWNRNQIYSNYKLSDQTLNAEYTPAWIEGTEGTQEVSVVEDGSNWIDIACRNGIRIDNFDNEIRDCKVFLYPYDNPDQLERLWLAQYEDTQIDNVENYSQRAWLRKISYQNFIDQDRVYAFNTEQLSDEGVRSSKPVDIIFSAAAGFKALKLLQDNGFHDNTIIVYYDWCQSSLNFKKDLIETWDGLDFDQWLLKNDLKYNFANTYKGNYKQFWEQEISKEFGSTEKFKSLWDRYCKLEHKFLLVNVVNDPEKLFEEINRYEGNKVLWLTNIWSSMMLHWSLDIDDIEKKYLKFESLIPNDLILYGHDYLSNDIDIRIRKNLTITHPRYESTNEYIKRLRA